VADFYLIRFLIISLPQGRINSLIHSYARLEHVLTSSTLTFCISGGIYSQHWRSHEVGACCCSRPQVNLNVSQLVCHCSPNDGERSRLYRSSNLCFSSIWPHRSHSGTWHPSSSPHDVRFTARRSVVSIDVSYRSILQFASRVS
jgi:hypothetical protein